MNFITPEVTEVALSLMAGLNCPRSTTVAILIRYGEWEQLVKLKCSPSDYCSSESYLRATAATDFLRKLESAIPGVDPEAEAHKKWVEAEQQCFITNRRLYELMDFGTLSGIPVNEGILDFIEDVKKNVTYLIGSGPPSTWEGRFGPGATMSDDSRRTTVPHKMSSLPTATTSALYFLVPWTGTKWASACAERGDEVSFVRGNSFFTVPKTALTRRSCAKEPAINGYFQLGLGRILRSRLMRRGINLEDGQNVHRQVACSASLSGEFCTIDLSSASDTLCRALVQLVMPRPWAIALDDLRSTHTRVDGRWHRLEKFSSMGNGFTFELETVIFTAIAMTAMGVKSHCGHNLWCYGDDIIVPSVDASNVLWALRFFGFTPNESKTYVSGPFRESCGGDFFLGDPVRAHFLKELPHEPQHYISLANGIRRLSLQLGESHHLARDLRRTWFVCLGYVPSHIRACRGPNDLGDIVIHDDESRWNVRWRDSIRYVRVYRPARFQGISFDRFDPDVQYAAALYGVALFPDRATSPEYSDNRKVRPRNSVLGYLVGWAPFS